MSEAQYKIDPRNIHIGTTSDGVEIRIVDGVGLSLTVSDQTIVRPILDVHALMHIGKCVCESGFGKVVPVCNAYIDGGECCLTCDHPRGCHAEAVVTWTCPKCTALNRDDYHRVCCHRCFALRPPNNSMAAELREMVSTLRRTPVSLRDIIPLLQRAADAIDTPGDPWISVDDELPEVGEDVFYAFNGCTFRGKYFGAENEDRLPCFGGAAGFLTGDVMFWMRVPKAPASTRLDLRKEPIGAADGTEFCVARSPQDTGLECRKPFGHNGRHSWEQAQ
jgi:hypothetical protein